MKRRQLLSAFLGLSILGASRARAGVAQAQTPPGEAPRSGDGAGAHGAAKLRPSGPIVSQADNQVIENLDVDAPFGAAISIRHNNVTVRNCRVRHGAGHGVQAVGAGGLILRDLDIDCVGAPVSGPAPTANCNNVNLEGCVMALVTRVKASRGSSNIYAKACAGARLSALELRDARGPEPRGQNVQLHRSPNAILEDFSAENGPSSWTEDNISVFRSNACVIRRGLVVYNNSPSGDGVMLEGSFDCRVEDVDALQQGNGAFAAVPQDDAGSGGCLFLRCRAGQSYNAPRDGRAAPSSNGLSIYLRISEGARRHAIADCQYDALANPRNLIWDLRAVEPGWSFTPGPFSPHAPIRLAFGW